jgi:hypothetical protein
MRRPPIKRTWVFLDPIAKCNGFGKENLFSQLAAGVFFRPRFLMGWLLLFKNQANGQPRALGLQTRRGQWTILNLIVSINKFYNRRRPFASIEAPPSDSTAGIR